MPEFTYSTIFADGCVLCVTDDNYIDFEGWLRGIECIHTGTGFPDNSYLILMLDVDGFHGHKQMTAVQLQPVAELTFVFEMECAGNCSFIFMDVRAYVLFVPLPITIKKPLLNSLFYQIYKGTCDVIWLWEF